MVKYQNSEPGIRFLGSVRVAGRLGVWLLGSLGVGVWDLNHRSWVWFLGSLLGVGVWDLDHRCLGSQGSLCVVRRVRCWWCLGFHGIPAMRAVRIEVRNNFRSISQGKKKNGWRSYPPVTSSFYTQICRNMRYRWSFNTTKYISVAPSRWIQGNSLPNWRNTRNTQYATKTYRRRNDLYIVTSKGGREAVLRLRTLLSAK